MQQFSLRYKAQHVIQFVIVQFIALVGWIVVQSFFSLSPPGRALPFTLTILLEAIWWIALLLIMLFLFLREYQRFVQSALDLEDANKRLREATNHLFTHIQEQSAQENSERGEEHMVTEPGDGSTSVSRSRKRHSS